jgi:hypothetical protein
MQTLGNGEVKGRWIPLSSPWKRDSEYLTELIPRRDKGESEEIIPVKHLELTLL